MRIFSRFAGKRAVAWSPWNGVWLPGHLVFWGMLIKLIPLKSAALQTGVLSCHVFTIVAVAYLTRVIGGKRWLGGVAALLIAAGYPFIWMGQGPLVETLIASCFMIGAAWSWRFCEVMGEHPARQWAYALGAGFFFFCTNSLHFVGWMAVAATVPFLLGACWIRRAKAGRGAWWAVLLILVLMGAFPVLWTWSCWRQLGHPFQYLVNQAQMLKAREPLGASTKTLWGRVSLYPRNITEQCGVLLPLGLLALSFTVLRVRIQRSLQILPGWISVLPRTTKAPAPSGP